MLVLRRRPDVLRALTSTRNFGMAAVTGTGGLLGCPLTGAEMQSPDGGLLNMNPPRLRSYRQRIAGLFTRRAAEATRPLAQVRSPATSPTRCTAGPPRTPSPGSPSRSPPPRSARPWGHHQADWDRILDASRIAFAVVPGPGAVDDVAAAWADLYSYYTRAAARPSGGLTTQLAAALDGHTAAQVAHVTGTVSNGFGAMLPVLAVAIAELARQPHVIASCTRGERTWASVADELLSTRTMFPVALPRVALADTLARRTARHPGHNRAAVPDRRGARWAALTQHPVRGRPALLPRGRAHPRLALCRARGVLRDVSPGAAGG